MIDAWSEQCQVHVTVDRARPGWRGEVGLVTSTLSRLRPADRDRWPRSAARRS